MSNKLEVFSHLLNELRQNVIRAECEEDLRYTLLTHYPTTLIEVTAHVAELINEATAFLRKIKKKKQKNKNICIYMMAHVTPEEEAAFNEILQTLEAELTESTTATKSPLNVRNCQFWFRLAKPKKPSVCSSHMIR